MKLLGYLCFIAGILLLAYIAFSLMKGKEGVVSPVPEKRGVKVIFVTP